MIIIRVKNLDKSSQCKLRMTVKTMFKHEETKKYTLFFFSNFLNLQTILKKMREKHTSFHEVCAELRDRDHKTSLAAIQATGRITRK